MNPVVNSCYFDKIGRKKKFDKIKNPSKKYPKKSRFFASPAPKDVINDVRHPPLTSGTPSSTSRSKRPGLRREGDTESSRLVVAMTATLNVTL